jgi:hypothetical protein
MFLSSLRLFALVLFLVQLFGPTLHYLRVGLESLKVSNLRPRRCAPRGRPRFSVAQRCAWRPRTARFVGIISIVAFVIDRRVIAERGVATMRIVPALDEVKDRHACLKLSFETAALEILSLPPLG